MSDRLVSCRSYDDLPDAQPLKHQAQDLLHEAVIIEHQHREVAKIDRQDVQSLYNQLTWPEASASRRSRVAACVQHKSNKLPWVGGLGNSAIEQRAR